MSGKKGREVRWLSIFLLAIVVFVIDRLAKATIQFSLAINQSITVIPGILDISHVRNPGAAFGLLRNQTAFFIVVTIVVVVLIIGYARRAARSDRLIRFSLGLQLGGALGNLFDRVVYGEVIDFIDFKVWPSFNVADMAIVTGVGLFALALYRNEGRSRSEGR